jgi:hypothetical protein
MEQLDRLVIDTASHKPLWLPVQSNVARLVGFGQCANSPIDAYDAQLRSAVMRVRRASMMAGKALQATPRKRIS